MSRIFLAKHHTLKEKILKKAKEKQAWLKKLKAFALKHGQLCDKKKEIPVYTLFDEMTARGFYFKQDPGRLWKKNKKFGFYTPSRLTKEGKALYKEFLKVSRFDCKELDKVFKVDCQFHGTQMTKPCYFWSLDKKVAGISMNEKHKWDPPKGFVEVTYGEYEKAMGIGVKNDKRAAK